MGLDEIGMHGAAVYSGALLGIKSNRPFTHSKPRRTAEVAAARIERAMEPFAL